MRLLAKFLVSILIVIVSIIVSSLALLQSKYGLPIVQTVLTKLTPYQLNATALNYNLRTPFSLTLTTPELIGPKNQIARKRYSAEYLSFTLSPLISIQKRLTFDQVLVSGLTLDKNVISSLPENLIIRHLALDNVSYKSDDFSFSQANLQLSNWKITNNKWEQPTGEFQFSASQLDFKQQHLTNVLLNSEHQEDKWLVQGLSFSSAFGNVIARGSRNKSNQWVIEQLTVSDAQIENTNGIDALKQLWAQFNPRHDIEIKRLDLLDINLFLTDYSLENLNLSAQSLVFKQGETLWQENTPDSQFSFNASLLRIKQWVVTDFLGKLSTSFHHINTGSLSGRINDDGFISLSGELTSSYLNLHTLTINGLDLNLTSNLFADIERQLSLLDRIDIKKLEIRHANIYALEQDFPAQVIGLNIHGNDLSLRQNGQYGMWQGKMTSSASLANINHVALSSFYADMSVVDGIWKLNPVSLSFKNGQLTGSAEVDLNNNSRAWFFNADGLNVPNQLYSQWLPLRFPLRGEHDVKLVLSGLANDRNSFAYSLTGDIKATPYRATLKAPAAQSLNQTLIEMLRPNNNEQEAETRSLTIEEIHLFVNRGRIELAPVKINSQTEQIELTGKWDLVTQEGELSITPK